MNRLRSLGCVVNEEWVGSPRLLAHAHVVSDKKKQTNKKKQIGESENEEEATPEWPFFLISRRGESDTGKLPDAPAVDLTLQTSPRSVQILYLLLLPPPLLFDSGPAPLITLSNHDQDITASSKGNIGSKTAGQHTQWQPVLSSLPAPCLVSNQRELSVFICAVRFSRCVQRHGVNVLVRQSRHTCVTREFVRGSWESSYQSS